MKPEEQMWPSRVQAAVKTGFAIGPGEWGEHSFQQASVHTRIEREECRAWEACTIAKSKFRSLWELPNIKLTFLIPEKQHKQNLHTFVSSAADWWGWGVANTRLWSIKDKAIKAAYFLKEKESTKNDEKPPKLQVWVTVIAKLQSSNFIRYTPPRLSRFSRAALS